MALIQLPFAVAFVFSRYSLLVSVITICFLLVIGAGFIAWGLAIRRRYYAYAGYAPAHSHQHLINREGV